ncbi:mycothiol synthase [Caldanaerobius fijiensis DSM 17918]|uniref:Mycothiol synthase n=1 Tax=Caldanaerobius fijiensis DSM 17918 TaxID=1121256 RepID=A0A1M4SW52_9THEO|nr:GNAT family N-acetyltransferase [Caldanaerobius fijiensis]SHE36419.1 mycothiol synthase [Caldanaerobius fijiensis DSM 17918]
MENMDLYGKSPQLVMERKTLADLPQIKLPTGYSLRHFRAGDEAAWENIINDSFKMESNFKKMMADDESFKPERVLFICFDDIPVATASAWHRPKFGNDVGYLHMVGVLSTHTGKGLGLQVSLAALHRMASEGKISAVLETDDFRIPAIKTYLKLGFKPVIVHENQVQRWENIFKIIDKKWMAWLI